MTAGSHYLHKEPCPQCGSRDNLARYSDGHGFCFGCGFWEPGPGPKEKRTEHMSRDQFTPIPGQYMALPKRGITEDTCRLFGYQVGVHPKTGRKVHLAPYYNADRQVVAQKWRTAEKEFGVVGNLRSALPLFGQHLWRDGGKKIVITEGEIDCMTVSQLQGNKWPVVSVPNGAQGAKRALSAALEWLERFDEVILMFDMDEPGRAAVADCAPLFSPGKCKVASLPLKDANEMLLAGRGSEVIDAIWGAKPYRPDGIRSVAELAEEAERDIPWGRSWFLKRLDALTFGRRDGELYAFGAGTGVGKTDLFTQSIAFDVMELGLTVGVLYLEQPPVETVRRVAGKMVGKIFHVPGKATPEERREAIHRLAETNRLHLYDQFGSTSWETVKAKVRFMAHSLGCKHIYLDHLTALVASEEDERRALDCIMAELAALALELRVSVHFISHLTRPEGKPHEEGGRVQIKHFRGSNAIGMWSHFMFGLERDQQADDEEQRRRSVLRCLKDRNTGQATGQTIELIYDPDTGLIHEADSASLSFNPPASREANHNPDF